MAAPIEAVIFDWGGTLSQWINQERIPEFWRLAATQLDEERVDRLVTALIAAEDKVWNDVRAAQKSGRLRDIMVAAAEEEELALAEEWFERAAAAYLEGWELELEHKPDAVPMLAALKGMGLKTGLVSNTHWPREFHEQLLIRDGLDELIDVRIYTSELSHVKPHPIAFRAVLSGLGVNPARAVFVGDRHYDDIFGAQSVGMRAVLVRPSAETDYPVTPDATIDSLAELVRVIDGWKDDPHA